MNNLSEAVNDKKKAAETPVELPQKDLYLVEFENLEDLQAFCVGLAENIEEQMQMDSELYLLEDEDVYCLILQRGKMDEKQVCRIMSASIEFMDAVSANGGQVAYIREHGKCVLKNRAISQMQRLFQH